MILHLLHELFFFFHIGPCTDSVVQTWHVRHNKKVRTNTKDATTNTDTPLQAFKRWWFDVKNMDDIGYGIFITYEQRHPQWPREHETRIWNRPPQYLNNDVSNTRTQQTKLNKTKMGNGSSQPIPARMGQIAQLILNRRINAELRVIWHWPTLSWNGTRQGE